MIQETSMIFPILQKNLLVDFKRRSTIGVPRNGEYSGNITLAPWENASGNLNHQLNFNDGGMYYRTGNFNNSTWNAWQKIMTTDAAGNLNSNLRIGRIGNADNLNVPLGSITNQYTIVCPGKNGTQPSLNLSYNSQNLNVFSVLGLGWSLGGLSEISRCQVSNYYDNVDKSSPIKDDINTFTLGRIAIINKTHH